MITADYHTHTRYSHGRGSIAQNASAAFALGLEAFAISEHGPAHLFYGVRGRKLSALREEVDRLKSVYDGKMRILTGMECNLTGFGRSDLPEGSEKFDVLLLGFHKGVFPRDRHALGWSAEAFGLYHADPVVTANALLAAAERYHIHILSHPGLYVCVDIPTLAKGAAQLGVWLELNQSHLCLTREEVQEAARLGAKFVLSSDAHSPDGVGCVHAAYQLAQDAGVLHSVVNLKNA